MFVNKHSDFLARGLLTGVDIIGILGLSSMISYGVNTILESKYPLGFVGNHTYLHVDRYFLCCSNIFVQNKTFYIMIGQYQWSSYDIQDVVILTYL